MVATGHIAATAETFVMDHTFITIPYNTSLYFSMGNGSENDEFKTALSHWGIWTPHLIHGSLGPHECSPPNRILIRSSIFAKLTVVPTNRQINHATLTAAKGCVYAICDVMHFKS